MTSGVTSGNKLPRSLESVTAEPLELAVPTTQAVSWPPSAEPVEIGRVQHYEPPEATAPGPSCTRGRRLGGAPTRPPLPGMAVAGATHEETEKLITEAIATLLEGLAEDGPPIPRTSGVGQHRAC